MIELNQQPIITEEAPIVESDAESKKSSSDDSQEDDNEGNDDDKKKESPKLVIIDIRPALKKRANKTVSFTDFLVKKIPKKNAEEKEDRSLFEIDDKKKKKELTCNEKFKKGFLDWMDKPYMIIFMSCLTFFALYLSDIQSAWCKPYVDFPFDIIQLFVFVSFTFEITLCSYCDPGYFLSLFFWLDLVSTLSLLIDVGFIFDSIIESIFADHKLDKARLTLSKISTASGTTRVLRILRIIKLIRIVKLYKTIHQTKMNMQKKEEQKKELLKQKLNGTTNTSSLENTSMKSINPNNWNVEQMQNNNDNLDNIDNPLNSNNGLQLLNYNRNSTNTITNANININSNIDDNLIQKSKTAQITNIPGDNSNNNGNVDVNLNLNVDLNMNRNVCLNLNVNLNGYTDNQTPLPTIENTEKLISQTPKRKLTGGTLGILRKAIQTNVASVKLSLGRKQSDKKANFATKEEDAFAKVNNMDDASQEITKESNISKVISSSLTNKIFFIVMIVLIVYPFLSEDFYYNEMDQISYNILCKYLENYADLAPTAMKKKASEYIMTSMDSFLPLINVTYNTTTLIFENPNVTTDDLRSSEIKTVYSQNALISVSYSILKESQLTAMLNFFRTVFVCIVVAISIILIEGETREYVLEPLEVMMEIVDKISKDPVNARNIDNVQSGTKATIDKMKGNDKEKEKNQFEIIAIKQSIIKISALLAMGFGQIGGKLIKKSLFNADGVTFKSKGKFIAGIYCVISIRNYNLLNKTLRQKIIILNNELNEIIHASIDRYKGCITKNLGDCTMAIWKYSNSTPLFTDEIQKKNTPMNNEQYQKFVSSISDLSVLSCVHIYQKLKKKEDFLYLLSDMCEKTETDFQLKIDLNLHAGISIEGVIGSSYKIDAVHVSDNVYITKRMRKMNKIYGVPILFTDEVFRNLGESLKMLTRPIDIIHFSFESNRKYKLYTIDVLEKSQYNRGQKSAVLLTKQEKEQLLIDKKKAFMDGINETGDVCAYVLSKESFQETLNCGKDDQFFNTWNKAFDQYEKGKWNDAYEQLKQCNMYSPDDGPTVFLMNLIETRNHIPPSNWRYGREIIAVR